MLSVHREPVQGLSLSKLGESMCSTCLWTCFISPIKTLEKRPYAKDPYQVANKVRGLEQVEAIEHANNVAVERKTMNTLSFKDDHGFVYEC